MRIEVIDVSVENKGKYRQATVSFKFNGKVDGKKLVSFKHKDVYKVFSEAKQGDLFDVKSEKNPETGYWEWTEVAVAGKNTEAPKKFEEAVKSTRSTYETPEERAKRQVYIVRQSSCTTAIEYLKLIGLKNPVTPDDVITIAKEFEAYVFGMEPIVEETEQPAPAEVK